MDYNQLPLHMNLVEVKIAQVRMTHTTVDPVYREVVGKESRNTITVECQNRMVSQSRQNPKMGGDETDAFGYLVFKKKYLKDRDIQIKKGDKVVEIAGDTVDYDITEVRSNSALGGKNLLVHVVYGKAKERASR